MSCAKEMTFGSDSKIFFSTRQVCEGRLVIVLCRGTVREEYDFLEWSGVLFMQVFHHDPIEMLNCVAIVLCVIRHKDERL